MNEEDQKLKEYSELKNQIRSLEEQLEELKPVVLDLLLEAGDNCIYSKFGTFVAKEKRTYEYPEDIKSKETELKALKQAYEARKDAVLHNVTAFVTYIPPKEAKIE